MIYYTFDEKGITPIVGEEPESYQLGDEGLFSDG